MHVISEQDSPIWGRVCESESDSVMAQLYWAYFGVDRGYPSKGRRTKVVESLGNAFFPLSAWTISLRASGRIALGVGLHQALRINRVDCVYWYWRRHAVCILTSLLSVLMVEQKKIFKFLFDLVSRTYADLDTSRCPTTMCYTIT